MVVSTDSTANDCLRNNRKDISILELRQESHGSTIQANRDLPPEKSLFYDEILNRRAGWKVKPRRFHS